MGAQKQQRALAELLVCKLPLAVPLTTRTSSREARQGEHPHSFAL